MSAAGKRPDGAVGSFGPAKCRRQRHWQRHDEVGQIPDRWTGTDKCGTTHI